MFPPMLSVGLEPPTLIPILKFSIIPPTILIVSAYIPPSPSSSFEVLMVPPYILTVPPIIQLRVRLFSFFRTVPS